MRQPEPLDSERSMEDDLQQFLEIERKRKLVVERSIQELINKRKILNETMQQELQELMRDTYTVQETGNAYNRNTSLMEDISRELPMDNETVRTDEKLPVTHPGVEIVQSDEIDGVEPLNIPVNMPISDYFIRKYIVTDNYIQTERILTLQKNKITNQSYRQLKLIVNKRIGQVTTDLDHINLITGFLKQYDSCIFYELLSIKIIEQAKLQVSNCFETYKSYGWLLNNLYTPNLHSLFLVGLVCKKEEGKFLKSMYSIYFELLRLRRMWHEAYNFFAGMLNETPISNSFHVVEAYLLVLGKDMSAVFGKRFRGITNYIREEYFARGDNKPCKVRIEKIIEGL